MIINGFTLDNLNPNLVEMRFLSRSDGGGADVGVPVWRRYVLWRGVLVGRDRSGIVRWG